MRRPRTPSHLGPEGSRFHRAIADEYGVADAAGLALLGVAAEALDRMAEARALIAKHGSVIEDRYGGLKANPAVDVEKRARDGFLAAVRALNMDVEPLRDGPGRPSGR